MTRNDARQFFKDHGLTYSDITVFSIDNLWLRCEHEICDCRLSGGETEMKMGMRMASVRKKDIKEDNGKFKAAQLHVTGSYFTRREAITFSETGFIGFGGDLDEKNVAPILEAFRKWCIALWEVKVQAALEGGHHADVRCSDLSKGDHE